MSQASRPNTYKPPQGQIRKSQMITTFGPGAMVDLIGDAVLVSGLDYWNYGKKEGQGTRVIHEPRLRELLAERLRAAGRGELSLAEPFREPPTCDDSTPSEFAGIQVLEFPQWFVCQACKALVRARDGLERKAGRYVHQCTTKRPVPTVPVRFVGACAHGHVQDWPWVRFVHMKLEGQCPAPDLKLVEGETGDFSQIVVRCETCHASQPLAAAMSSALRYDCEGRCPWLGGEEFEECTEKLRLLVRTASNSYFAQVVSALSVPDPSNDLANAVADVWETVKVATKELLPAFRSIPKVGETLHGWSDAEVLRAISDRNEGRVTKTGPLRTTEFQQFMAQPPWQPGERAQPSDEFFARRFVDKLAPIRGIERIVVAPKLREVRAQIGFTRFESIASNLEGEYDIEELNIRAARLGTEATYWLPAVEVLGEGVFVRLDERLVAQWEQRPEVLERAEALFAGYQAWASRFTKPPPPFPGVRYYMLHSLSHLLLTAIALDCGYAASSIRERIYCASADSDVPMAAILVSTGTPGAEGTLGGLVDQAGRMREHLRRAYDLATLCSSDPVCARHNPRDDRAERHLEGAACHACLFMAECSCERFNNCLDRALVVPTLGQPSELAFLGERP